MRKSRWFLRQATAEQNRGVVECTSQQLVLEVRGALSGVPRRRHHTLRLTHTGSLGCCARGVIRRQGMSYAHRRTREAEEAVADGCHVDKIQEHRQHLHGTPAGKGTVLYGMHAQCQRGRAQQYTTTEGACVCGCTCVRGVCVAGSRQQAAHVALFSSALLSDDAYI